MTKNPIHVKHVRKPIPSAIRQQVWIQYIGEKFKSKCYVNWCKNKMTIFNYHVGHNIPDSKGGTLDVENLRPICVNCNLSMSDNYTIDEWNKLGNKRKNFFSCCFQTK
jgi:5-methylcytosine-specific restriction endonuclease McrA